MKTFYVQFVDFREETLKASSVRITAKMVSFYRRKSLVLAVPVSEITRIADTPFKSYEELDREKRIEADKELEPLRARIKQLRARGMEEAANGAAN